MTMALCDYWDTLFNFNGKLLLENLGQGWSCTTIVNFTQLCSFEYKDDLLKILTFFIDPYSAKDILENLHVPMDSNVTLLSKTEL